MAGMKRERVFEQDVEVIRDRLHETRARFDRALNNERTDPDEFDRIVREYGRVLEEFSRAIQGPRPRQANW